MAHTVTHYDCLTEKVCVFDSVLVAPGTTFTFFSTMAPIPISAVYTRSWRGVVRIIEPKAYEKWLKATG